MHPETMIRHISEVRRIGDLRGDDIDCWCDGAPDANPDHQPCPMCRALEAAIDYGVTLVEKRMRAKNPDEATR